MAEAASSGISSSVQSALDWAAAVARVRERTPPADPGPPSNALDLVVGAMLAHADENGEVRVLLSHFGLTVRDVVGEDYARVTPENLRTAAPYASGSTATDDSTRTILAWAERQAGGNTQLLHVVGGMLSAQTELMTRFEAAFNYIGESRQTVAASYERWLSGNPQDVRDRQAGALLREWLQANNPRTPVSVAGFSTDDVAGPELRQQDLVGISPEANALAYLVASRELVPPLAVGLFGDWGSGKSFLMRDVRHRVDSLVALCADQPQHDSAIWKNIEHIEFNAWEYVQGDLWAGLLEKIFRRLGSKVPTPSLVSTRKDPVKLQLDEQQRVVEQAEAAASELTDRFDAATADVKAAEAEVQRQAANVEQAAQPISDDARAVVILALRQLWSDRRVEAVGADLEELSEALDRALVEGQNARSWIGAYLRDWRRLALVTVAVLLVPGIPLLLEWFTSASVVTSLLAGLAAAIPVLTGGLTAVTAWSEESRRKIEEARREIGVRRAAPLEAAQRALAEAEARQATLARAVTEQAANLAVAKGREQELQNEFDTLTPGRVFAEYADKRSTDYRSQLGILGTVREDLRLIESVITPNNEAAALRPEGGVPHDEEMPNRIVLYIDDLDRCPPAKVVQVLEAVHLLLAFPLFVVFVAVDSRWLSSALIEELHALRVVRRGPWSRPTDTPTARDYLEKIFQLPFWVQPLSTDDRSNIVTGLLAPTVRTEAGSSGEEPPGGLKVGEGETDALDTMVAQGGSGLRLETSALALSPEELAFLTHLGPLLSDTPRRIKRFVNTVQFLLSIRPPLPDGGERSPRRAVALLAAIHEGLPSVASEFFKESNADKSLEVVLKMPGITAEEHDILDTWLGQPGHQHWRNVTTREIGERREMVERLGFDRPVR